MEPEGYTRGGVGVSTGCNGRQRVCQHGSAASMEEGGALMWWPLSGVYMWRWKWGRWGCLLVGRKPYRGTSPT